jgi:membrane protein implicated in regulation of membrane protease activity
MKKILGLALVALALVVFAVLTVAFAFTGEVIGAVAPAPLVALALALVLFLALTLVLRAPIASWQDWRDRVNKRSYKGDGGTAIRKAIDTVVGPVTARLAAFWPDGWRAA